MDLAATLQSFRSLEMFLVSLGIAGVAVLVLGLVSWVAERWGF